MNSVPGTPKAFLSHSSANKEFVRAVAKELGRQFCIFDEYCFDSGVEFKKSIEEGLDSSAVFVLFASQEAKASIWVKFEADEAWYQRLQGKLDTSLVYLIDSSITHDDVPEWLGRSRIQQEISPKVIARDIRHHLDALLRQRQVQFFIGRSHDVEKLETALTPLDGSSPPHVVLIWGLPGIGRRTFIRETSPSILKLRKHTEIHVGEGDTTNDICIRVADRIEPYSTREGFGRIVEEIRSLSEASALQRILSNIRAMCQRSELPIFINEGGILDSDGYICQPILNIFQAIAPDDDAYIFIVSPRKPQYHTKINLPAIHLDSLKKHDTQRLISRISGQEEVSISAPEARELAEYVAGYPPAAFFAVQQAKNYGTELVISNKHRLVQFRTKLFVEQLAKAKLDDTKKTMLRILASYSPLPLPVITKHLQIKLPVVADCLVLLIDYAFVITTTDGFYRLADPVKEAAAASFGFPSESESKSIAAAIDWYLNEYESNTPQLELSQALFRAAKMGKDSKLAIKAVHLANDLVQLTESLYHQRKYRDAIDAGFSAIDQLPRSETARGFLIRALIQVERWSEAEHQIETLKTYAPQRNAFYLLGFLNRNRNKLPEAISSYLNAERSGWHGAALNRELAFCYFHNGHPKEAKQRIDDVLRSQPDNKFAIDLAIKIATALHDEASARAGLDKLELIDDPSFYYHRLSRVELTFGKKVKALTAAREALEQATNPAFEVLTQLANCEIENGNLQEAEELLQRLEKAYGNVRRDIRIGLQCRLAIARKNYRKALELSEKTTDKGSSFYKKIRLDALSGELKYSAMDDSKRQALAEEKDALDQELQNISGAQFVPE